MHFLTLSLLLILLPGMAVTHAQNKINLEIGRSTLQNVFTVIQQQTDYRFLYSTEDVSSVNVEGISVKETDVEKVLSILLKNSGLVYQISDNLIFIKQMKQSSQQMKGIKISGKVTDPKGEVLPGVTVLLKGTTVGCATDAEGKFSFVLTDLKDVILLFRYIGMEAKEIRLKDIADTEILKGNKELSVVLSVQTESLEDVVVTGYANVRKESYTGNSVRIDGKDIMKVANRNIISALQVFDPSFRMMENNLMGSDPNTMPEFYIRGQSGVGVRELDVADVSEAKLRNNPNLPIFILDGFDVSVEKIYDMDPNRIHSVTILKDAAATAIYG
ncbi:MAG: carboxypeptidase-like regulatory domain-containing protein, partial [Odoribacter sp.]